MSLGILFRLRAPLSLAMYSPMSPPFWRAMLVTPQSWDRLATLPTQLAHGPLARKSRSMAMTLTGVAPLGRPVLTLSPLGLIRQTHRRGNGGLVDSWGVANQPTAYSWEMNH